MKWAYRGYAVDKSRICPTGKVFRPEAKIRVGGPAGDAYLRALIDTGADHSILPISVAKDIGVDLNIEESDYARGVSGHEIVIIPGQVELELLGVEESYRWKAVVGFAEFENAAVECSLLGYAGCLEFLLADFDGQKKVVELTKRANFPRVL